MFSKLDLNDTLTALEKLYMEKQKTFVLDVKSSDKERIDNLKQDLARLDNLIDRTKAYIIKNYE